MAFPQLINGQHQQPTTFNDLPVEIRHMIWDYAMPGPRILRVRVRKCKGGRCTRVWSDKANDSTGNESFFDDRLGIVKCSPDTYTAGYGLYCPPDPNLTGLYGACLESHRHVLKTHSLAFGSLGVRSEILFNFESDTLYLDSALFAGFQQQFDVSTMGNDRTRVQNLALDRYMPSFTGKTLETKICDSLRCFGNIKNISLVLGQRLEGESLLAYVNSDAAEEALLILYSKPYLPGRYKSWKARVNESVQGMNGFVKNVQKNVEEMKTFLTRLGLAVNWTVPSLTAKYLTTPDRLARLEKAELLYEKERQGYHTKTTLYSQNYAPLTVLVTLTTCIRELVDAFRRNQGISNDFDITIKSGDSSLESHTNVIDYILLPPLDHEPGYPFEVLIQNRNLEREEE